MEEYSIIAEIAQAHDGSLGILHSYIDALASTGVTAIKFQTHIAEAESSIHEPFRVPFSYVDKSRYDYWKRMEFSFEEWVEIKRHCEAVGLEFISSPFSLAAVDLLEKLGVKRYKIASGEVRNLLMLARIRELGKPIILSSGMSDFTELDQAVRFLSEKDTDLSVLQCTTMYPTPAEQVGLNLISELKRRYNLPVGLSDHSGQIYPCLAAAALGATIFEFHAVFDRRMFGPDSIASLTIDEIRNLAEGLRFLHRSVNSPVDKKAKDEDVKRMFGKSLAVKMNLKKGDVITEDLLETKKPAGFGLEADRFSEILGKKLKRDLKKYEFINLIDVS